MNVERSFTVNIEYRIISTPITPSTDYTSPSDPHSRIDLAFPSLASRVNQDVILARGWRAILHYVDDENKDSGKDSDAMSFRANLTLAKKAVKTVSSHC